MSNAKSIRLTVGTGAAARELAVLQREGGNPGLFWLGGFRFDMTSTKAAALDAFAAERGLAATRFDYSGRGASSGRFEDGTISLWLEESIAVFDAMTTGPQIVVGWSMGGWMALLLAEALHKSKRIVGVILIAPAIDMTRDMWDHFDDTARSEIIEAGALLIPDDNEPYPITHKLIKDGKRHLFGDRPIATGCPVRILHGSADTDIQWQEAAELVTRLTSHDVVFTMMKNGDHQMSRPADLDRLRVEIESLVAEIGDTT
jgi:pimeloyl-ACP methyl ester carboxylesterase